MILRWEFFCFIDIKMRHLKNLWIEKCLVSYRSLILNFFIFNGEILIKTIWDFEIPDCNFFQSHPCLLYCWANQAPHMNEWWYFNDHFRVRRGRPTWRPRSCSWPDTTAKSILPNFTRRETFWLPADSTETSVSLCPVLGGAMSFRLVTFCQVPFRQPAT